MDKNVMEAAEIQAQISALPFYVLGGVVPEGKSANKKQVLFFVESPRCGDSTKNHLGVFKPDLV